MSLYRKGLNWSTKSTGFKQSRLGVTKYTWQVAKRVIRQSLILFLTQYISPPNNTSWCEMTPTLCRWHQLVSLCRWHQPFYTSLSAGQISFVSSVCNVLQTQSHFTPACLLNRYICKICVAKLRSHLVVQATTALQGKIYLHVTTPVGVKWHQLCVNDTSSVSLCRWHQPFYTSLSAGQISFVSSVCNVLQNQSHFTPACLLNRYICIICVAKLRSRLVVQATQLLFSKAKPRS